MKGSRVRHPASLESGILDLAMTTLSGWAWVWGCREGAVMARGRGGSVCGGPSA